MGLVDQIADLNVGYLALINKFTSVIWSKSFKSVIFEEKTVERQAI